MLFRSQPNLIIYIHSLSIIVCVFAPEIFLWQQIIRIFIIRIKVVKTHAQTIQRQVSLILRDSYQQNYELCIMNYELTLGVPAIAVGLSAISLLALPATDR